MSEYEEPQNCTKCRTCPEDILTLNCGHDLCLVCASARFAYQKRRNHQNDAITCEVCSTKTALDPSTVGELDKYLPVQVPPIPELKAPSMRPSPLPPAKKSDRQPQAQASYQRGADPTPRASYRQNNRRLDNLPQLVSPHPKPHPVSNACSQHPEDEILYFCFTCQCQCICPECVIHGPHKNHDVKTLKRSVPEVKERILETADYLEAMLKDLEGESGQHQKKLATFLERLNSSKKAIKVGFDRLRKAIDEQEQICLTKCDYFIRDNKDIYEKALQGLTKHSDLIRSQIGQLTTLLKSSQIKLLNGYANNRQKYAELRQLENTQYETPDIELEHEEIVRSLEDLVNKVARIDFTDKKSPRYKKRETQNSTALNNTSTIYNNRRSVRLKQID